jgi:hypothetical protein
MVEEQKENIRKEAHSQGLLLGQMLTKLENIDSGMRKMEEYDKRIGYVEKDQIIIKHEVEEIRKILNKPKSSWFQIMSGIAGIGSTLLVLLVVLPKLLAL